MANYDFFTNSTTYKAHVTDTLNTAFSLYPNFDQVHLHWSFMIVPVADSGAGRLQRR
jgi:hypothetical protein